jgi:hypothetical protein
MALDFNTIVFFGDSLTDDGNLPEPFQPDPPYVGGRFTNGPVYAELLPGELGTGYDNFAFGGAQATTYGPRDLPLELISLPAQVDLFLARSALEGGVREGTAAAIFIGTTTTSTPTAPIRWGPPPGCRRCWRAWTSRWAGWSTRAWRTSSSTPCPTSR